MSATCLITGASSGIGKALTQHYAANGWTVYAVARTAAALHQLAQHSGVIALPLDVTDNQALEQAVRQLQQDNVQLDVVILNAGTCEYVDAKALDLSAFRRTFTLNVLAVAACCKYLLPLLQARAAMTDGDSMSGSSRLAIVSSMAHMFPFTRSEAYGASKAAVSYFADSLRADLAQSGVSVHLIEPGFIKTPLTDKNDFPMPFLLSAQEAATRIYNGLEQRRLRLRFPFRLSASLTLLRLLPYRLRASVAARLAR